MRRRKPRVINSERHPSAAITFEHIAGAWLIHDQQIYRVVNASPLVFKAAVLDLAPHWKDSPIYGEALASVTIDAVTR